MTGSVCSGSVNLPKITDFLIIVELFSPNVYFQHCFHSKCDDMNQNPQSVKSTK